MLKKNALKSKSKDSNTTDVSNNGLKKSSPKQSPVHKTSPSHKTSAIGTSPLSKRLNSIENPTLLHTPTRLDPITLSNGFTTSPGFVNHFADGTYHYSNFRMRYGEGSQASQETHGVSHGVRTTSPRTNFASVEDVDETGDDSINKQDVLNGAVGEIDDILGDKRDLDHRMLAEGVKELLRKNLEIAQDQAEAEGQDAKMYFDNRRRIGRRGNRTERRKVISIIVGDLVRNVEVEKWDAKLYLDILRNSETESRYTEMCSIV